MTNDDRYRELMDRELDGANTPEESAALKGYLAANPEARRQFDGLVRTVRLFDEAGSVEPPAEMEPRILDAIAAREAAGRERGFFLDFLSPRRKLAYAFAAGIAVGIIVFVILYQAMSGGNTLDVRDVYGSLAAREGAGKVIDARTTSIAAPGCTGTAIVQYRDEAIIVHATVTADAPVELAIEPAGGLPLRSLRTPDCGPHEIRGSASGLSVSLTSRCELIAVFADRSRRHPDIRIGVTGSGSALFDETIEMGKK